MNMFIPSGSDPKTGYSNYANIRDTIRIKDNPLSLSVFWWEIRFKWTEHPYSLNGSLEEGYTKGLYIQD